MKKNKLKQKKLKNIKSRFVNSETTEKYESKNGVEVKIEKKDKPLNEIERLKTSKTSASDNKGFTFIDFILNFFTNKVGIDLGTVTTVVFVQGKGIVFKEPTLVSVNKTTEQITAIGEGARISIGRTPEYISIIQPIKNGVVSDYEITVQLFEHLFKKVQDSFPKLLGPSVVVGIPCKTSQVEISAIREAALEAGAYKVDIVYEPLAAAIGIDLALNTPEAKMVIDVGGGTSDMLIISNEEIVDTDSIQIAGDSFDNAIIEGLENDKDLIVGIKTAEDIKISTMNAEDDKSFFRVQGTNTQSGLPHEVEISLSEIISYIEPKLDEVADFIVDFVERSTSDIHADLKNSNIYFVGGGALVKTFAKKISNKLNLELMIPEDAILAVSKGTSIIANEPNKYKKYFL